MRSARAALAHAERFDRLDHVRAGAMLIGVAYHATYAFIPDVGPYFPVQAEQTWAGFVTVAGVVHALRMPVFFALSGFFAALVLARRPGQFLEDRFKRLVVPAFVALPVSVVSDALIRQASLAQGTMAPSFPDQGQWLVRPQHLWFLPLLFLFCGALKAPWRAPKLPASVGVALAALVTTAAAVALPEPEPAKSFVPSASTVAAYAPFFAFGVWRFGEREQTGLDRHGLVVAALALAVCLGVFTQPLQWQPEGKALASVAAWLFVVGVMGWALRPGVSAPSFFVQAAYWVYLVHHPLVQLGQVLVAKRPWPAVVSYALVVVGAGALSLASFWLISSTAVGRFLGAKPRTSAQ